MARIAGIDLPREKRIEIGLTYIYGIGRKSANDILKAANNGAMPDKIALLTPRQVIPASLVEYCENLFGKENVVDAQDGSTLCQGNGVEHRRAVQ